jgi:hypothetical protein
MSKAFFHRSASLIFQVFFSMFAAELPGKEFENSAFAGYLSLIALLVNLVITVYR